MMHETTAPLPLWARQQMKGGGWGVGRRQKASHINVCNSSVPSRCQLMLPRLVCTQLTSLHYARDYRIAAGVGASTVVTDEEWGLGCGMQTERKAHQLLQFKCVFQVSIDLATPCFHTTDVFACCTATTVGASTVSEMGAGVWGADRTQVESVFAIQVCPPDVN